MEEKRLDVFAIVIVLLVIFIFFLEFSVQSLDSGLQALTGKTVDDETIQENIEEMLEDIEDTGKVSEGVLEELEYEKTVKVIVVLKDTFKLDDAQAKGTFEEQKEEINEIQEDVLEGLDLREEVPDDIQPFVANSIVEAKEEDFDMNVESQFKTINAITGNVTVEGLAKLAENSNVEKIIPPFKFSINLQESIPYINADDVWVMVVGGENINGSGQVICVLDTGIDYNHIAFGALGPIPNAKIIGGYDFVNDDSDPLDAQGHGTHVAGTMASMDSTYTGVAPGAKIVAIKVCDDQPAAGCDFVLEGIDWCVNNATKFNITTISMSIGFNGIFFDSLAACELASFGAFNFGDLFVAASAGNDGATAGVTLPACLTNVTSVGAIDDADSTIASFSNRGSLLDVMAPGRNIRASTDGGGWDTMSGTSMAAPHVAGAAALLKQYSLLKNNRNLTRYEVTELLKRTENYVTDGATGAVYPIIDVKHAILSIPTIDEINNVLSHKNGSINYTGIIDFEDVNYCVEFKDNLVTVKHSDARCAAFIGAANVILSNLGFDFPPIPYKDGVPCTTCTNFNYAGGNFSFDVIGFSNYTAGINSQLMIYDDNDPERGSQNKENNMQIYFFANYTNLTSNAPIDNNTDNGWCNISFNAAPFGPFDMDYNLTSGLYYYNRTFVVGGSYTWDVMCNATLFADLNLSDSIGVVHNELPNVTITSPINQSVYEDGSTVNLIATATDFEDGALSGDDVIWVSDVDGNFANGTNVLYDVTNGTYNINVTAIDSRGFTDTDYLTIYVKFAPVTVINSPASGSSYTSGKTITFTGNATDIEDGIINGTNLTWTSSRNGQFGSGEQVSVSTLNAGTHTITLRGTDSDSMHGEDAITVTIVSTTSSSGSGGGGGGGGSSSSFNSYTPSSTTHTITSSQKTITINTYDNLKLSVNNRIYTIEVSGVGEGSAFVEVDGISKYMYEDTSTAMDINRDGVNDVTIYLDSTSEDKVVVKINQITVAAPSPVVEEVPTTDVTATPVVEEVKTVEVVTGDVVESEPVITQPRSSGAPIGYLIIGLIVIGGVVGFVIIKHKSSGGSSLNISKVRDYGLKYKRMGYSDKQIKAQLDKFFTTTEIEKGLKTADKDILQNK